MFKKVDPKQSFPKMEEKWMKAWKDNKIFEKSVEQRPKDKEYVFYDGPPFATGLPHYGHLLAGTMKDVVPRYQTMRGHRVERVFGWDCHGLPIENEVEGMLEINGKKDIEEKIGVSEFCEKCRSIVLRYTKEWEQTVDRMGRWVDFENDYKTMTPEYMESIWWVFKQLWEKKLIYEGRKTMHVCPRCVTPLSNFEVTQGYKDVKDLATTWKFRLKEQRDTYLLAWTTVPWSSFSTMGLTVGPDFTYVKVKVDDEYLIFVKDRLEFVMKGCEDYEVVEEIKGKDLVGKEYEPLDKSMAEIPEVKENPNVFKVYAGDYVEMTEGTGIVTINGSYGEIDMEAASKNELPIIMDVDMDGNFNELGGKYKGMYVKDMEKQFVEDGRARGLVWNAEKYTHSYPHCWRCDAPLLNYAMSSWFVDIQKIKKTMVAANQKIHWVPDHLRDGRFGKWLDNAKDWCISRNRFWGAPLPIWASEDSEDVICVGSIEELEELSGQKVEDLHKHFVDEIVIEKDGKKYRRIPEVLDCWFESGSMPYAQFHYPFENKEKFEANFPAEFIAEGLDQTRGWFYTLVVLGTALFDKSPFKNVIVNGLILAEDGKKMSKRLKNYPAPEEVFDKYGADALRFYLMNSPVVRAEPLKFSEKGVEEVVRKILLPIWNSYSFFVTYANIDKWKPDPEMLEGKHTPETDNPLDRWIISELETLLRDLTTEMDQYDLQRATEPIVLFIESLTNWYIRRSRRRFWKSDSDEDKNQAYATLYYCLVRLSQIMAPFTPFMAEEIYTNLTSASAEETEDNSVHLSDWPDFDEKKIDLELNAEVDLIRTIVTLGHGLRAKSQIKVRQPLQKVRVALPENIDKELVLKQKDIIIEELNVKDLEIISSDDEMIERSVNVNARVLGPKYGGDVQKIIQTVKAGDYELLEDGKVKVLDFVLEFSAPEGEESEVEVGFKGKEGVDLASEKGVVVILDVTITEELKLEGYARDIVRYIQDMRKEADYQVDDRIVVGMSAEGDAKEAVEKFGDYIKSETLAETIEDFGDADKEKEVEVGGEKVKVGVRKA